MTTLPLCNYTILFWVRQLAARSRQWGSKVSAMGQQGLGNVAATSTQLPEAVIFLEAAGMILQAA